MTNSSINTQPTFEISEAATGEEALHLLALEETIYRDPRRVLGLCARLMAETSPNDEPIRESVDFAVNYAPEAFEFDEASNKSIENNPELVRLRGQVGEKIGLRPSTEITLEDVRRKRLQLFIERLIVWQSESKDEASILPLNQNSKAASKSFGRTTPPAA